MKTLYNINLDIFNFFLKTQETSNNYNLTYLKINNLYDYNSILTKKDSINYFEKINELKKIIEIFNNIEKKTKIPYFTMKSFLNYPFIDDDIDFIICEEGYNRYVQELKKLNFIPFNSLADIREPMKKMFKNADYSIIVHLHSSISWNGIITCDKQDIFQSTSFIEFDQIKVRLPSPTDELLIAIGHFLFENYYFKIGELIYFKYLLDNEIDYNRINKISKEYGYSKGVILFFSYINSLSNVYKINLNIPNKYKKNQKIDKKKMFPYYIPYYKLTSTYIENFINGLKKRQFLNIFRKLFTYTLVGFLWKYILQLKKQKKLLSLFRE
jgi:hypothetical protein